MVSALYYIRRQPRRPIQVEMLLYWVVLFCKISIEVFAMIANFKMILHLSHLNGTSKVGRSENGSIPNKAHS